MATQVLQPAAAPANALARRSLLAGLAAAPLAVAVPVAAHVGAAASTAAWHRVVQAERRAFAVREAFYRDVMKPASDLHIATLTRMGIMDESRRIVRHKTEAEKAHPDNAQVFEVEERYSVFVDARHEALMTLYLHPAPHLAALAYKLRFFIEEEDWTLSDADEITTALLADVERLGSTQ